MLTTTEKHDLIAAIRDLPAQLEALVAGLTDAQLTTHFHAGRMDSRAECPSRRR